MKTLFLSILFSMISVLLYCQNWKILNPVVTSYYSHSDSIHLTNTINIDSVIADGVIQNYYISNRYKVCDTCDFNPEYEVIIHRYAKEFLGFGIQFDSINSSYVVEGDTLYPQAGLGEIWQFNNDLSATISSAYSDSVIGELDSLKTITLSSNDTIILSKNHGIIRYPDFENVGKYYELKGYHNNDWYYGEVFPNFWSIYDFAVGDEYCGYFGNAYMNFYDYKRQIEILSLISIDETAIVYETTARGSYTSGAFDILEYDGWSETTYYNSSNTTQTFYRYPERNEDFFGNKVIGYSQDVDELSPPFFQSFDAFNEGGNLQNYAVVKNEYISNLGYQKTIREFSTLGDSLLYSVIQVEEYYDVLEYVNFLGRTFFFDNIGFGVIYEGLHGAVISGDTIGAFCNFPFDLGIESHSINPLSIHPNPATSQIIIEGNYESLEIYSQTGQLVMNIVEPKEVIDVSKLPSGIYFLKATSEEKLYVSKLIIE